MEAGNGSITLADYRGLTDRARARNTCPRPRRRAYQSPEARARARNRTMNRTWYPVLQAQYRSMAGLARWEPSRIDFQDLFCPALVDGLAMLAAIQEADWTAEEQATELAAQAAAMDERWNDTVPAIAYRVGLGLTDPAELRY